MLTNKQWVEYYFSKTYPTDILYELIKNENCKTFYLKFSKNLIYSRQFGPAITALNSYCFYKNNKRHRLNAPAFRNVRVTKHYEYDIEVKNNEKTN